jgi:tRNA (guanine-N7-)-methyltransferase
MQKEYPRNNYDSYRKSRNPYFEKLENLAKVEPRPLARLDAATEQFRGVWRQYFGVSADAQLELELGAYHGETLSAMAKANSKGIFLGVEWKYKQCFVAAKKAADQSLDNLCFLRANMSRLAWMVAPGEVNRVFILFPDPWSKATHQKWRVLHPGFFKTLGCLLAPGAELFIKTDHADYFEYIKDSLRQAACFDSMDTSKASPTWDRIPPTPFEKIFLRQGRARDDFFKLALVRNAETVVPPQPVWKILEISPGRN